MIKKSIVTLIIVLVCKLGISQSPSLTYYNIIPEKGETFIKQKVDTSGVTFENTGANYLWDYSFINVSSTKIYSFYIDPDYSPYYSLFPSSNLANGSMPNYSYYYCDTNEYTFLGRGNSNYTIVNSDPEVIFVFPFKYGDELIDSFEAQYTTNGKDYINTGFRITKADGWGTIVLPKNSYNNVLRIKGEIYSKDTAIGESTEQFTTFCMWYNGIRKEPLLSISVTKIFFNGNPIPSLYKSISVAEFTETDIPSEKEESFYSFYPNPTTGVLNFQFINTSHLNIIVLMDLSGKIIKQEKCISERYQMELSGIPNGLYLLKVNNALGSSIDKILIY